MACLIALGLVTSAHAWIATVPGAPDEAAAARGVAVDANGDVYASGSILDGGDGHIGVAKFAGATGARLWTSPVLPGAGYGVVLQLGTTPVVVGMYEAPSVAGGDAASASLDPATGAPILTSVIRGWDSEYWIAVATGAFGHVAKGGSLTPSGASTRQFAVQFGGWPVQYVAPFEALGVRGPGIAWDVAIDGAGDAIAVGITDELVVRNFPNQPPQVVTGPRHLMVVKIQATDGTVVWQHVVDEVSEGVTVAVDGQNDVIVGGAIATTPDTVIPDDLLVMKLAGADGTEQWRRTIDGGAGSSADYALDVAADAAGDVIVAGRVAISPNDPIFFGGLAEFAVLKLGGADGAEQWRYLAPNTNFMATTVFGGTKGEGRAITFAADGDPVVAGTTNASWFEAGPSAFGADFTVVKLQSSTGTQQWLYVAASGAASAIATASDGIVVAGRLNRDVAESTVSDFAVVKLSEGLAGTSVAFLDSADPTRRKIKVKSKDRRVTSPAIDRYGDPRWDGGRLVLVDPVTAAEQVIDLPPAEWRATGSGYEYKSISGPCRLVRVDNRRGISATCKGSQVHLAPAGATRAELALRVELGPPGAARFCMRFGGQVVRDDGISFKAKAAPAPAGCSGT
jgi:hypothetical protein